MVEVVIRMPIPGADKENIHVNATSHGVEVQAEAESEVESTEEGKHRIEQHYAGFYRYVPLPSDVDTSQLKAVYKDGVLEIRAPRTDDSKGSQVIQVD